MLEEMFVLPKQLILVILKDTEKVRDTDGV